MSGLKSSGVDRLSLLPPSDGGWWLYVLLNKDESRTYVGVTTDVERRLAQHNSRRGAKATRPGRPWSIAKVHGPFNKSRAHQLEWDLKKQRFLRRLEWVPPTP